MSTSIVNGTLKIGVIGLGRAGWLIHLKELQSDSRFEVVSVADPDPARTAEAVSVFGCKAFSSIAELVAAGGVEAVVVATPSWSHVADASLVLNSGLHCIVEKPMATTYEEAIDLVALSRQTGKQLFVHHQQPFRPEFVHLREVIDSGILGEVFHLEAYWSRYARRWDWQTLRKNGGGQLNNHGSHCLSLLLPLLDAPVAHVAADLRNIKDAGDAEDHVNLLLKAANGRTASMLVTSACALPGARWRLLGSHGTLSSDGVTSTLRYCDPEALPRPEVIDAAAPGRAYQQENLPWREETRSVEAAAGAGTFYGNVYQVLREGAAMRVTPGDVLEIMRVIELAREAAGQYSELAG